MASEFINKYTKRTNLYDTDKVGSDQCV